MWNDKTFDGARWTPLSDNVDVTTTNSTGNAFTAGSIVIPIETSETVIADVQT